MFRQALQKKVTLWGIWGRISCVIPCLLPVCSKTQVSVACTIVGVGGGSDSLKLMRLAGKIWELLSKLFELQLDRFLDLLRRTPLILRLLRH